MKKLKVIVERLNNSGKSLKAQILEASDNLGLIKDSKSARTIFIKPNLTYPKYKKGVTTRKEFVNALVTALIEINPNLKIYIGEGEAGYNCFSMSNALEHMGFFEIEEEFPQVKILNLSKIPSKEVLIATPQQEFRVELPEIFFNGIDLSISCPVPKVHCMTKVSLSFKNQWGCLPDTLRLKNHFMFDFIISKLSDILKFKYAFLDGKYALDNNGPMDGNPVEVNWFVASNSLGAFDIIVCELMGITWNKVSHLKMASKYSLIPQREDIELSGDISLLKRKFVLKRNFWNYTALLAFKSKKLTKLFYFSEYSKILHDIMYTFRKRQIYY